MARRKAKSGFNFAISLSVLNHLGRNLYRNFITVVGEAISNAWDAEAKSVWIDIDREENVFTVKDDGDGMSSKDFQSRFLKVGYSKRKTAGMTSKSGRPFIGAKGIGKLALLSSADRISVFSKKRRQKQYVGGVIDNAGLDRAIKSDLEPDQYPLEALDFDLIEDLSVGHKHGTILVFEGAREILRTSDAQLRKLIAMYFQFTIIDPDFSIYVDGDEITIDDLGELAGNTEFIWTINKYSSEYTQSLDALKNPPIQKTTRLPIRGFLATVEKPSHLKIRGTEERASVDLFVNGRLREKDILSHIPAQRIVENYLYGQIHFDSMDRPGHDPFTSSREGIVQDDEQFQSLLDYLKRDLMRRVIDEWDGLRWDRGQEGDEENTKRASKKQRRAAGLYSAAKEEFEADGDDANAKRVNSWLTDLRTDAEFNLSAYIDCFLTENLIRRFISFKRITLKGGAATEVKEWRLRESKRKQDANISFAIRKDNDDLSYLGMNYLAEVAEGGKGKKQSLSKDGINYLPVRNAVGHTGLLTTNSKNHLTLIFENVKGRLKNLLGT